MIKKNILFIFAFCFGFSSLMVIPGSKDWENSQFPEVWGSLDHHSFQENANNLPDVQFFFRAHIKKVKKILMSKLGILREYMLMKKFDTPIVILELPHAKPLISETVHLHPN